MYICGVTIMVVENISIRVQIQAKAVYISHAATTLEKNMHPNVFIAAMGKK